MFAHPVFVVCRNVLGQMDMVLHVCHYYSLVLANLFIAIAYFV